MLRAEFLHTDDVLTIRLEGRLVSAWAAQVKSLISRNVVPAGFLVDVSDVTYVDSTGEQLLIWLSALRAVFVAQTCYAHDVCERLHLTLKEDADRHIQLAREVGSS
jgi:hypothetical protein